MNIKILQFFIEQKIVWISNWYIFNRLQEKAFPWRRLKIYQYIYIFIYIYFQSSSGKSFSLKKIENISIENSENFLFYYSPWRILILFNTSWFQGFQYIIFHNITAWRFRSIDDKKHDHEATGWADRIQGLSTCRILAPNLR